MKNDNCINDDDDDLLVLRSKSSQIGHNKFTLSHDVESLDDDLKSFYFLLKKENINIIDCKAKIKIDKKVYFSSAALSVRHGYYLGSKVAIIKYKIFNVTKYYNESEFYDFLKEAYILNQKIDCLFNFIGVWFHDGFCFFITEFPSGTCLLDCYSNLAYNEKLDITIQIAENYNKNPEINKITLVASNVLIQNNNKIKFYRNWIAVSEHLKRKLGFHTDEDSHTEKIQNKDIYFHPPEIYIDLGIVENLYSNVYSLGCIITFIFSGQHPWTNKFNVNKVLKKMITSKEFIIMENLPEEFRELVKEMNVKNPDERKKMDEIIKYLYTLYLK